MPGRRRYTYRHQQERKRWAPKVAAGLVNCARCGKPILPGQFWDLGHSDFDRTRYAGPEHRRCNRATNTPGRATASKPKPRKRPTSRDW